MVHSMQKQNTSMHLLQTILDTVVNFADGNPVLDLLKRQFGTRAAGHKHIVTFKRHAFVRTPAHIRPAHEMFAHIFFEFSFLGFFLCGSEALVC